MTKSESQTVGAKSSSPDSDRWVELERVERDICLLYHQLSGYRYIMADLRYGSVFGLPYWDYLNVEEVVGPDRQSFIRQGCLMMILAMAWDTLEDSGNYIQAHLPEISAALDKCMPWDRPTRKLLHSVKLAIKILSEGGDREELMDLSCWAHGEFVGGYFREMAKDFALPDGSD